MYYIIKVSKRNQKTFFSTDFSSECEQDARHAATYLNKTSKEAELYEYTVVKTI